MIFSDGAYTNLEAAHNNDLQENFETVQRSTIVSGNSREQCTYMEGSRICNPPNGSMFNDDSTSHHKMIKEILESVLEDCFYVTKVNSHSHDQNRQDIFESELGKMMNSIYSKQSFLSQ